MTSVAVVAHAGKTVGGGLEELRRELLRHGVDDPIWHEVPKSRFAPKRVRKALAAGYQLHATKPVEPLELVALVASLVRVARSAI